MKEDPNQTPFGKAILAGLFAGLLATLACFAFDITYRISTGYDPSELINVSSIIFIVNPIMLAAGIVYYAFKKSFKKGDLFFTVLFILLTIFCIWKSEGLHRFADYRLSQEFRHLLSGSLLIIGICGILIPPLFNNKKVNDFIL
jgi:hypothetical protein